MHIAERLYVTLLNWLTGIHTRLRGERGDVPGWVLVAIMSAGLVILIWAVAGPLLTQVFQDAIGKVSQP